MLYQISDPVLRFWFYVFSPHRSRWSHYWKVDRLEFLNKHVAAVFEDHCRNQFPLASRYWESDLEFESLRFTKNERVILSEVKWQRLGTEARASLQQKLEQTWHRSKLSSRFKLDSIEILDQAYLKELE